MGKNYEQQITVPIAPEHVAQRAAEVLAAIPKAGNVSLIPPVVRGDIGVGMMSWGEKVTITVAEAPGGSSVHIHSKCSFPLQLVDYGKNRKNVEKIIAGLQPPAAPPAS